MITIKLCYFLDNNDWINEYAIFRDREDYIAELNRDGHFNYKIKAKKLDNNYYVVFGSFIVTFFDLTYLI